MRLGSPGRKARRSNPGRSNPGPEYVYEMPEDFQEQQRSAQRDSANGNAKGRSRGREAGAGCAGRRFLVGRAFGQPHSWHVGQGFPEDVPVG